MYKNRCFENLPGQGANWSESGSERARYVDSGHTFHTSVGSGSACSGGTSSFCTSNFTVSFCALETVVFLTDASGTLPSVPWLWAMAGAEVGRGLRSESTAAAMWERRKERLSEGKSHCLFQSSSKSLGKIIVNWVCPHIQHQEKNACYPVMISSERNHSSDDT